MSKRNVIEQTHKRELLDRLSSQIESDLDEVIDGTDEKLEASDEVADGKPSGNETSGNKIKDDVACKESPNDRFRIRTFLIWVVVLMIVFVLASYVLLLPHASPVSFVGPLPSRQETPEIPDDGFINPSKVCLPVEGYTMPAIEAEQYVAVFADSFSVAFESGSDEHVPFASIVKLLGILVALENYSIDEKMALLEPFDAEGNGMDLEIGEEATVNDLIGAALVGSKNDAMMVLAQNYPGGVPEFINAMQRKAESLGLDDTSIANPVGYDDPLQYATPRDIAVLMAVAMRNSIIREIVAMPSYTIHTSTGREEVVSSTNQLLGAVDGVIGGKTGFTTDAGWSMVNYVADSPDFVTVVMHATDRYEASEALINAVREGYVCY